MASSETEPLMVVSSFTIQTFLLMRAALIYMGTGVCVSVSHHLDHSNISNL